MNNKKQPNCIVEIVPSRDCSKCGREHDDSMILGTIEKFVPEAELMTTIGLEHEFYDIVFVKDTFVRFENDGSFVFESGIGYQAKVVERNFDLQIVFINQNCEWNGASNLFRYEVAE